LRHDFDRVEADWPEESKPVPVLAAFLGVDFVALQRARRLSGSVAVTVIDYSLCRERRESDQFRSRLVLKGIVAMYSACAEPARGRRELIESYA